MAATKTTTPPRPASPYAGYPYPYTHDHSNPKLPGVPHRPKICAEGIPLTWARTIAYITHESELRRRRKWYSSHQKDIDSIINNEPPHPIEAKQWSQQSMHAMRFYRRCCWDNNAYPIESVHVDCLWYGDRKGKGRAMEDGEKVIPNYTLKCHRCSDHDRSNEQEEIRPHPDEEWWCATCHPGAYRHDDFAPEELVPGEDHWYGSNIEAFVTVLPQPQPVVATAPSIKSTETVGKRRRDSRRRDSALGNMLSKVKSVITRSQ